jgi:hypothetical protein
MKTKIAVLTTLITAVAMSLMPASAAAAPPDVVRASLLTTSVSVDSARFRGTLSERGYFDKLRVISTNTVSHDFNFLKRSDRRRRTQVEIGFAEFKFDLAAINGRLYAKLGRKAYYRELTRRAWNNLFTYHRARSIVTVADESVALLSDWRDDGAGVSDGVAVQNYSGAIEFQPLAAKLLPNLTEGLYDAEFRIFASDPEKWRDAAWVSAERPRVTFSVDAANLLRRVVIQAPPALTTQGYELSGAFEYLDVNEDVKVRPPARAKKVTKKQARKIGF